MESEPHVFMKNLSESFLDIRFNVKNDLIDYFIRCFATRTMFRILGITPKRFPLYTLAEDFYDFSTKISSIPRNLGDLLILPNRPRCKFPNSDEWIHWIRENVPEGMLLEDFESFVYYADVFGARWLERYMKEMRIFYGIRIVCNILVAIIQLLIIYCLYSMVHTNEMLSAVLTGAMVVLSLMVCAYVSKELK
jgi:hypothetical protein